MGRLGGALTKRPMPCGHTCTRRRTPGVGAAAGAHERIREDPRHGARTTECIAEARKGSTHLMLRSLKELERYSVVATDGDLGSAVDFLVDDERWTVRYLVVETGHFLNGHRVLISPIFFRHADWATRRFHIGLTREKIKGSPDVDVDKPVSRQHEQDYYGYYGYPYYWGYSGLWGAGASPGLLAPNKASEPRPTSPSTPTGDAHLRSVREILGYDIQGTDGSLGHVADLVVEDETWEVRYLVLDTNRWWGRRVLLARQCASRVSWAQKRVSMNVSRAEIKASPAWDGTEAVNRAYESHLYDYYGRPVYWAGDATEKPASSRDCSETHRA